MSHAIFRHKCAEVGIHTAEIRLGEMLAATERAKGATKAGTNRGMTRSPDVTTSEPTLSELGISKRESSEAQMLAATERAKGIACKGSRKNCKHIR